MPRLGVDALEGGGDDPGPYCIGSTGQRTSRVGAILPGPYVQATVAPHLDVEHVKDVDVDIVEVPRLLLLDWNLWNTGKFQMVTPRIPSPPRFQSRSPFELCILDCHFTGKHNL